MSPRRFQLEGSSLEELRRRVRDEHGPHARIIAVDQITTGGLGGFFATRRFEATVEVPDLPSQVVADAVRSHNIGGDARVGIAALLADADAADLSPATDAPADPEAPSTAVAGGTGAATPSASGSAGPVDAGVGVPVSTASPNFAAILEGLQAVTDHEVETVSSAGVAAASASAAPAGASIELASAAAPASTPGSASGVATFATETADVADSTAAPPAHAPAHAPDLRERLLGAVAAPPAAPALVDGVGDLVVVAGLPRDAHDVARAMAATVTADIVAAGTTPSEGLTTITDRRDAITARARGVQRDRLVIAAYGIDPGRSVTEQAEKLRDLRADQLWLAVDAGRKTDDTARWVATLTAVATPDGIAGVGRAATASPDSIRTLGIPVTWEYDR